MSTMTDNPTTGGVSSEVAAYVGLVRAALRDLSPEEIDDLTGGLEADLSELAAESEEPLLSRLGEPSAYAEELRSAAGLPAASPVAEERTSWWRESRDRWRARWQQLRDDQPWLEQLRPVWWVFRGAVLGFCAWLFLGSLGGPLIVVGAALSFWAGLNQDRWAGWRTRVVMIANVVALVFALPFLAAVLGRSGMAYGQPAYIETPPSYGVWVSGTEAGNLYVYDGQGQRVDGARIFTHEGAPLSVNPWNTYSYEGPEPTSNDVRVFPLAEGEYEGWDGAPSMGGWVPPVAIPPAFPIEDLAEPSESVATPEVSPTLEPTGEATGEPTDGPTGAATGEPTGDPTGDPTVEATAEPTVTATP